MPKACTFQQDAEHISVGIIAACIDDFAPGDRRRLMGRHRYGRFGNVGVCCDKGQQVNDSIGMRGIFPATPNIWEDVPHQSCRERTHNDA